MNGDEQERWKDEVMQEQNKAADRNSSFALFSMQS